MAWLLAASTVFCGFSAGPRVSEARGWAPQPAVSMSVTSRRSAVQTAAFAFAGSTLLPARRARAIGPTSVELSVKEYTEVACPPELAAGRIGGSLGAAASKGVKQRCVRVTVTGVNPSGKQLTDSAVFGRVFNEAGNSIVANNQDGRTDAGQFAMIPNIATGESTFDFVFVATDNQAEMGKLRFESLKAIAYPGGDRYKVYDPCEQNPAMEGCGMDD
ncbi:hypothetical protein KFE25_000956 [Diacronema lutheri]|uniref:Uncharacterized protein n=1 Tax=Diacronema lutheri TaxID=2081491 RepID=A0A8J5XAI3_DIALT|nr:hypothetical protein KFE25_000956 [Diacronema lutheri]